MESEKKTKKLCGIKKLLVESRFDVYKKLIKSIYFL